MTHGETNMKETEWGFVPREWVNGKDSESRNAPTSRPWLLEALKLSVSDPAVG